MSVSTSKLLRISISFVIFSVTISQANAALVAYWNFDEESGNTVADLSGNGFDGTINGATRVPGFVGPGALVFDGFNDIVTVLTAPGDALDFAGQSEVTVMAWVQAASAPGGICCGQIVGQRDGGLAWALRDDGRDIGSEFELLSTTNAGFAGDAAADGVPRTTLGEWHHVAAVIDLSLNGGEASLYVNGVLSHSYDVAGTTLQNQSAATRLDIGGAGDGYFSGEIDEVRVYDTALTASQIVSAITTVPEPGSLTLACFFLAGITHVLRRKRRRVSH